MIKLQDLTLSAKIADPDFKSIISGKYRLNPQKIKNIQILRRSIDVRHKNNPTICYTVTFSFGTEQDEKNIIKKHSCFSIHNAEPYHWKKAVKFPKISPIIVGSGPAGIFAALTLCYAGIPPIIVEMGEKVENRSVSVKKYWNGGPLNEKSNVQFGEGGAGTFSDGKLNTGIKDIRCRTVLETFVKFGADRDILINAKPHVGTDVLRRVIVNMRNEIESLGGRYLFGTEFLRPIINDGKIIGAELKNSNGIFNMECENLILALGNSSRNTFKRLHSCGIKIIPKPFSLGVRIEHLQKSINISQYGDNYLKSLPPCDYKLATHLKNGRGVYSFCMCPGGVVVNSASEHNTFVTNGMSYKKRDLTNANSAILVGVDTKDFVDGSSPFGGIELQEKIEKNAFALTNGEGVPVQCVGSLFKRTDNKIRTVQPTVLPSYTECELYKIFPSYIMESIASALEIFDRKIKGFSDNDAVMTAPETRSSCPIRIERDENFCSNTKGIYPCGEGSGYAGGITSSAVDGIRCAESIIQNFYL